MIQPRHCTEISILYLYHFRSQTHDCLQLPSPTETDFPYDAMSDSIDARPRYGSCRPFDGTDSDTSRCVTSVRLWAGGQSPAESRQCDILQNRLFLQLSVKAIQIVKFFNKFYLSCDDSETRPCDLMCQIDSPV